MKIKKLIILIIFSFLLWPGFIHATPTLTLEIEGGFYDTETETWMTHDSSFTLKLILSGSRGIDELFGVNLVVAIPGTEAGIETGSISLDGGDTTIPSSAFSFGTPQFDEANVGPRQYPSHDIYPSWFALIDVIGNNNDSSHGDSDESSHRDNKENNYKDNREDNGDNHDDDSDDNGFDDFTEFELPQTVTYDVVVSGFSWVHFDAFGYYETCIGKKGTKVQTAFVPPSHDAEFVAEAMAVPEPSTFSLMLMGFSGFLLLRNSAFKRKLLLVKLFLANNKS